MKKYIFRVSTYYSAEKMLNPPLGDYALDLTKTSEPIAVSADTLQNAISEMFESDAYKKYDKIRVRGTVYIFLYNDEKNTYSLVDQDELHE